MMRSKLQCKLVSKQNNVVGLAYSAHYVKQLAQGCTAQQHLSTILHTTLLPVKGTNTSKATRGHSHSAKMPIACSSLTGLMDPRSARNLYCSGTNGMTTMSNFAIFWGLCFLSPSSPSKFRKTFCDLTCPKDPYAVVKFHSSSTNDVATDHVCHLPVTTITIMPLQYVLHCDRHQ
jgi:hypothetical protein